MFQKINDFAIHNGRYYHHAMIRLLLLVAIAAITSSSKYIKEHNQQHCDQSHNMWNPQDTHPCTIRRLSQSDYLKIFGKGGLPPLYPDPIVITMDSSSFVRNRQFRYMSSKDQILASFPANFTVTLSSSNSFSEHRRTIPFSEYLKETQEEAEMLPNILSNETWYLFGETYSQEWKEFLKHYEIPTCLACENELVALSFGIGNRGSGVQWHVHGPGFSESIIGRKHWLLYGPKDKPIFHPDQTSRNWMEYNYLSMDPTERPFECTLNPGDIIYFPNMWWHATVNLDEYTAFVSTFTQEHLFATDEII